MVVTKKWLRPNSFRISFLGTADGEMTMTMTMTIMLTLIESSNMNKTELHYVCLMIKIFNSLSPLPSTNQA
jgi:hypothetical protein